ncbi:MAG TPA: DUF72 domain-containing protein [Rhodanobacter sp.]|nr:DUF72 domain-containing protein [Rhodanobacter sp.]
MTVLSPRQSVFIGCAGWSIPAAMTQRFPDGDSRLERYAQRFNGVEVNSSFYRPHLPATWRRWAATVPPGFRFAVKMPRSISHEARLRNVGTVLRTFLDQVHELGTTLGCLLLQLPPSLTYVPAEALPFFDELAQLARGPVVCEPRHASWFLPAVDRALRERAVGRVAADPAGCLRAAVPGGDHQLEYFRLHGSPRIYYDAYSDTALRRIERRLRRPGGGVQRWCIFDNTALGHSVANGLDLIERIGDATG